MIQFPIEIVILIFAQLDGRNQRSFACASKDLNEIFNLIHHRREISFPQYTLYELLFNLPQSSCVFVVYAKSYSWDRYRYGLQGLCFAS